ncbi:MAG: hypothetical protein LBF12_00385 [Christensenellaceae bacterium]|nr:hypothetical protein [Christensenellaceae bacterium]
MGIFNLRKIKELIKKVRSVKNIEIIIGVIVIFICLLAYLGFFDKSDKNLQGDDTDGVVISNTDTYDLERRLASILKEIEGAGDVKVMITYNGTPEIITANTTNTHKNSTISSGSETFSNTETVSPIVVNNNGRSELIIIKEVMPEIKGVLVVAKGASNIRVRLELLRAVSAILDLDTNVIEVFTMK